MCFLVIYYTNCVLSVFLRKEFPKGLPMYFLFPYECLTEGMRNINCCCCHRFDCALPYQLFLLCSSFRGCQRNFAVVVGEECERDIGKLLVDMTTHYTYEWVQRINMELSNQMTSTDNTKSLWILEHISTSSRRFGENCFV